MTLLERIQTRHCERSLQTTKQDQDSLGEFTPCVIRFQRLPQVLVW